MSMNYIQYCLTPEGAEDLKKMMQDSCDVETVEDSEEEETDEIFRINESRNDDDYDFYKETLTN